VERDGQAEADLTAATNALANGVANDGVARQLVQELQVHRNDCGSVVSP
jgi:hypothetical protein